MGALESKDHEGVSVLDPGLVPLRRRLQHDPTLPVHLRRKPIKINASRPWVDGS